jgi:hypothetical protein
MSLLTGMPGPFVWLFSAQQARAVWDQLVEKLGAERLTAMPGNRHPFSPWITLAENHPRGQTLLDRLTNRQDGVPTFDDPTLPDPKGTFEAVAQWVRAQAEKNPLALYVMKPEQWGRDSVDLILYLTRRLETEPVAILIDAPGLEGAPQWRQALAAMEREIGLTAMGSQRGTCSATEETETGGCMLRLAACGAHHAVRALLGPEHEAEGWTQARLRALLALEAQDDATVDRATTRMHLLASSGREGALALRIRMLSLHRRGDKAGMLATLKALRCCHADADLPRGWVFLDEAAALSLTAPPQIHCALLDRLISLPDHEAPPPCRATGFIWRGAAAYRDGDANHAAEALSTALPILDRLGEFTRATHVRVRLGFLLSALGRSAEAAAILRVAAEGAIALGNMSTAAMAATEAACAAAADGEAPLRSQIALFHGWKSKHLAAAIRAAGLHQKLAVHAALADDRLEAALEHASRLEEEASDRPNLRFEAALMRARIALRQGTSSRAHLDAAATLAEMLEEEEMPLARLRLAHFPVGSG